MEAAFTMLIILSEKNSIVHIHNKLTQFYKDITSQWYKSDCDDRQSLQQNI